MTGSNLSEAPLTDPVRVRLFSDAAIASAFPLCNRSDERDGSDSARYIEQRIGTHIEWDGRPLQIIHVGSTGIVLADENRTPVELTLEHWDSLLQRGQIKSLAGPTPPDDSVLHQEILQSSESRLKKANWRAAAITPHPSCASGIGETAPSPNNGTGLIGSPRSRRRWKKNSRESELRHGYSYVGLLSFEHKRGNRKAKIPEAVQELMDEIIASEYENIVNRKRVHVHAQFMLECGKRGLIAPSFKTFCTAVKARSGPAQTEKLKGKRAAYQEKSFIFWLEADTPRHGERPFEIGYLDHYEFPVELISPRTAKVLGKAWGSIMTDGSTRRTLAVYPSFEEPSYRSCLMVLRLCVRRFGRLPKVLVVDHGPEFESVYFQTICAFFGIDLRYRPAGQPRGGSTIERLCRTTETRFMHELLGNTQLSQNGRQLTKAVSAKENAVWTLARLSARAWEFFHEYQDNIVHPALGESPCAAFARGLMLHGERSHKRIAFDQTFKLMTMPGTKRRTAMVHPQKGVRINYFDYWSPAFSDPKLSRMKVKVRYDPWDLSIAYAEIHNCWIKCHSSHNRLLHGRTEKELIHATSELKKQAELQGKQAKLTALKLAQFMAEVRDEQTELLREKASFNKEVIYMAEGTLQTGLQMGKAPNGTEVSAGVPLKDTQVSVSPADRPWDTPVDRDNLGSLPTF